MLTKTFFAIVLMATFVVATDVSARTVRATYSDSDIAPLPGNGNFEVTMRRSRGATQMFCDAADYAVRWLGASSGTRLYVLNPEGTSQTNPPRRSVGFTINPSAELQQAGQSQGGISVSVQRPGFNLSVGHSLTFCRQNKLRIRP